ncbi:MAG: glycosyltransferase [Heteroscytonema crispum UTEX LB 1556]
MTELAIFLSKSLLGWLVIQVLLALVFLWNLRSSRKNSLPDNELPKTAVILCLRGADPFLANCLRSLFNQNYPNYDLKLIVDSQEDAAWKIATDTILEEGATNVEISPLRIMRHNCSLKCSSIVQAISELDDSHKVIALVDADTIVHPNWLRELVIPLTNPNVGATTGNRWYVPTGKYWGSLVRYIGNTSSVVQMYLFRIPWGGTLAVKADLLYQTGLLNTWAQAFSDDFTICKAIKQQGMQIKFVPSLIMLNQEECDLPSLITNLQRLILCARFYNPSWMAIVSEAISSILFPTVLLMLFLTALLTVQWEIAALIFAFYCSYTAGLLLVMLALEQGVKQVIRFYNEPTTELSTGIIIKMSIAIPLTQWVYGWAMLSSLWIQTVKWRGVTYRVTGPWNINLVEYRPFELLEKTGDRKLSL